MKVSVFRKEHFNAAHRLHNPDWSDEMNQKVFGKCNNPNYHGHNYELEVTIIGYMNEDTGYVIDTKILSTIIKEKVLEPLDHKNLNVEVSHFENVNPTVENIAIVIYNLIKNEISKDLDLKIKLYEAGESSLLVNA